jgi:hypothetical protein
MSGGPVISIPSPGGDGVWRGNCRFINHQRKAGGLKIGGPIHRLKEKAAEGRQYVPGAERPSGGLLPPYGNQGEGFRHPRRPPRTLARGAKGALLGPSLFNDYNL